MLENKEIWKDCKGYEGRYQVSNKGRVWSVVSQKYLKPWIMSSGYKQVIFMCKNGKRKNELIHRLVALAFIDNPTGLPQVNHIDENKQNNCVENLEWCTAKYNSNYSTHVERVSKPQMKKVYCVELDKTYESAKYAAEELGLHKENIQACCRGITKTCGKYHWRYV